MSLIVVMLIGEPEQIRAGRGEVVITVAQACARLGLSESGLRQYINAGELVPVAKVAKARLFKEADVEELRNRMERRRERRGLDQPTVT